MKKIALAVLLLLIALNAYADNDDIRLRVTDADGNTKMVTGRLLEIDFNGWRLHVEVSQTVQIWINFVDVDQRSSTVMFRLLADKADKDPAKLYESARYMLFINRINSAEGLFEKAIKAGLSDEEKINDFKSQVSEFYGQELVNEIQMKIAEGDFKDARKLLDKLKDKEYEKTQAYKKVDSLELQLKRAEQSTKEIERDSTSRREQSFAYAIGEFERMLASGHEVYFKLEGGLSSTKDWDEIIKNLDYSNDKGMIVDLKKFEMEQPEGLLRNRITKMREKATEILICAYKSVISFYIALGTIESFKIAFEYLRKAVVIAPLDREIIYYWYLYDEYKQYVKTESETDKNKEEEDRND